MTAGPTPEQVRAVALLLGAVRELLLHHDRDHHARVAAPLGGADARPADHPSPLPVLDVLPAALPADAPRPLRAVADQVRALAPGAVWTRTASYLREPPYPGFADRYAHATLAGLPDGRAASTGDEASLGLLLLGPETHYPPHHHPADEVYVPLGDADWLDSATGDYLRRPAGTPLHHRPWQPHAVRTGTRPLLAVYLWSGDVSTPSRWL